ncbi:MAG: pilus assembly protein [Sphingomonadales bacterium]|nr:pilus assembly protein [Sphingomonadales bacterium]MDE2168216.1 pilus assembly protein [Sphingomonadales bacterium]
MLRRLRHETGGIALVEFAIVLPVIIMLFVGSFLISDMISCYRKVTSTTRALADLVSRSVSPSAGQSTSTITTYLSSAQLVMTPYSAAATTVQISNLRMCDATHAYVVWSQAQTGSTSQTPSLTAGTVVTIPANLVTSPMVPTSPDGSNVCSNTAPSTATKTQVGTAGGYLYYAQVSYAYTAAISYSKLTSTIMGDQIFMSPRLN